MIMALLNNVLQFLIYERHVSGTCFGIAIAIVFFYSMDNCSVYRLFFYILQI